MGCHDMMMMMMVVVKANSGAVSSKGGLCMLTACLPACLPAWSLCEIQKSEDEGEHESTRA